MKAGATRRDRPGVLLLCVASGAVTGLGTLSGWLVGVAGSTNAFVMPAALLVSLALGVLFILGLVADRTDWLVVGAAGLAFAWLWDVMSWGYRSFVRRPSSQMLVLAGLAFVKLVVTIVVGALGVVVTLSCSPDAAVAQSTLAVVEHVLVDHQALDAFLVGVALHGVGVVLAAGGARARGRRVERVAAMGAEVGGGGAGRAGWNVRTIVFWLVIGAYVGGVVMVWVAVGYVGSVHR